MSVKHLFNSLLLCVLLSACTSIHYKQQGDDAEGYSDKMISNNLFEVTFQTYRNGDYYKDLKALALKRASELSIEHDKAFFLVLSEKTDSQKELITIPEHKIHSIVNTNSGSQNGASTQQEIETIIPAHNKEFTIQKLTLTIETLSEYQDGALEARYDTTE